jgi:hypothetical protein
MSEIMNNTVFLLFARLMACFIKTCKNVNEGENLTESLIK